MSEQISVELARVTIKPYDLIEIGQKVPLDGDHIPLFIFDREFPIVKPSVERLGDGAIQFSLGRPFGFMRHYGGSQTTDGIILAPHPHSSLWLATLNTAEPLTELDTDLFRLGISFYAETAQDKHLRNQGGPPKTRSSGRAWNDVLRRDAGR